MKMVAVHCISHNWDHEFVATGRYNDDGEMIVHAVSKEIAPGTIFDCPESDIQDLLDLDAIREPTPAELALFESQQTPAPANDLL